MRGRDISRISWLALRKQRASLPSRVGPIPVGVGVQGQVCQQVTNQHLQGSAPPASGTWRGTGLRLMEPCSLCHLIWLLDARMALQFGRCWRRASLCEERGSAWPPALLSPRLWGKGNKLQMASLTDFFREKTATWGNGGGEERRCSSWRSSACVTCREHCRCPTEQCWWASALQGMSFNCIFQVRCGLYVCQDSIKEILR